MIKLHFSHPQEFSTKNKVLITGTPLQNSVEELWYVFFYVDFFD